jgi:hypothetical protein
MVLGLSLGVNGGEQEAAYWRILLEILKVLNQMVRP